MPAPTKDTPKVVVSNPTTARDFANPTQGSKNTRDHRDRIQKLQVVFPTACFSSWYDTHRMKDCRPDIHRLSHWLSLTLSPPSGILPECPGSNPVCLC